MSNIKIPLFKVHFPEDAIQAAADVMRSGFISQGPLSAQAEVAVQNYIGNPNTLLTNSCTMSIAIALRLAGVGPGTSVLCTPQTCVASNVGVINSGANIIWCDINPKTGNIDPESVRKNVTADCKAILFTDWGGMPCQLDELNAIARDFNLKTIQDCAHSIGAYYKNKMVGNICDYTVFSLQAIKHINSINGGILCCSNPEEFERAKRLRWFGLDRSMKRDILQWDRDLPETGFKGHMCDIEAAILLKQLNYLDGILNKHRSNSAYLRTALKDTPGIEFMQHKDDVISSEWVLTVLLDNAEKKKSFADKLTEAGIECAILHTRNDKYQAMLGTQDLPGVLEFEERKLAIPCGWWLTQEDLDYIVSIIKKGW